MRKKIIFTTGSRSDFGLIQSIVRQSGIDKRFQTTLLRVGHSLENHTDFDKDIKGVEIHELHTPTGIGNITREIETPLAISEIIERVSQFITKHKPDIIFLPGDRFEIFACAISAYYLRAPIAHIFGGDKSTGGHLDDNIRHAITKMAHLHFPVCKDSYTRIINLGEEPSRIFNFGSPVVDNLSDISFKRPFKGNYAVMTYHPITTIPEQSETDVNELLAALIKSKIKTFITPPNNEFGSKDIINAINTAVKKHKNLSFVGNLGWKKYLNYIKFASFSIGNSSSNLLETPILGTYSINVGPRQDGRFAPESVIHVECKKEKILEKISSVLQHTKKHINHPYGNGNVANNILNTIDTKLKCSNILHKKITY